MEVRLCTVIPMSFQKKISYAYVIRRVPTWTNTCNKLQNGGFTAQLGGLAWFEPWGVLAFCYRPFLLPSFQMSERWSQHPEVGYGNDGFRGMAQVGLKIRILHESTTIDIYMLGKILHVLGGLSSLLWFATSLDLQETQTKKVDRRYCTLTSYHVLETYSEFHGNRRDPLQCPFPRNKAISPDY